MTTRIIYTDDTKSTLMVISTRLEEDYNYTVVRAESVDTAIDLLTADFTGKREIELILSDYLMPEKDGLLFLRETSATFGNQYPFMFLSDMGTSDILKNAITLGTTGFESKPALSHHFDTLDAAIKDAIDRHNLKRQMCEKRARNHYIRVMSPMLDKLATKLMGQPELLKDIEDIKDILTKG
ncbi:MAG: response regulator [Desulfobacteraceae bacterium]|nr:response regulator [Desulfobacteraceae bacterium]